MATQRWILFLLAAAMMAVLAGCGGVGSGGTTTAPQAVTIAFNPAPATSVAVGLTTTLTAVVTNDSNNYGVDWALTCSGGNCGSLSLYHTSCQGATCASTTYTAPSPIAGNSESVNIVAYATADHTKNSLDSITVSTFDNILKAGNYVFQAQGSGFQVAGVVTLDGQGNVTGGEQTVNSLGVSVTDQGLTGNYFLGNDGRGTITINDATIGTEIYSLVFLNNSSSQALISTSSGPIASATGTLDPQTSTAPPTGSYAFVMGGTALLFVSIPPVPIGFGGVIDIVSSSNITGVADEIFGEKVNANGVAISGSFTPVVSDPFGTVIFNLSAPFGHAQTNVTVALTGYIVDATHIRLIESDQTAPGPGFGSTIGLATAQTVPSGGFTDASLPSGTSYVFGVTGVDLSPNSVNNGSLPNTLTSVGLFQADGSGGIVSNSGYTDTFLLYNTNQGSGQTGAQISAAFDGKYAVDSTGRTRLNQLVFTPKPQHGYSPTLFFYLTGLTGSGNPAALVLAAGDTTVGSIYYPSVGTGAAYQQSTASASLSGHYGFSFTQNGPSGEIDGTAQMNANAGNTPPVSGLVDVSASPDNGFLGTFNNPTSNLPFSGTLYADPNALNNGVFPLAPSPPMTVDYYFIDEGHGFFVETDLASQGSGQISFGYYAARTPACESCP